MSKFNYIIIALIAILATLWFVFGDTNKLGLSNADSLTNTEKTSETLQVLWDEKNLRITTEKEEKSYFVLIEDRKNRFIIPLTGFVGGEVGFVNDQFVGINIVSEAGYAHLVGGSLIDRTTREVASVEARPGTTFLGFTQDGSSYLLYSFLDTKRFVLNDLKDTEIKSYDGITVRKESFLPDFIPLRSFVSPDSKMAVISGIGYYQNRERENERHLLFVLSFEDGTTSQVKLSEDHYVGGLKWLNNTSFELWSQVGSDEKFVVTYQLVNGEWQEK